MSFFIRSFSIIFSRYESLARNLYCCQKIFFSKQFCLWRYMVTLTFERENSIPNVSFILAQRPGDVSLSLYCISSSIKFKMADGMLSFALGYEDESVWFCSKCFRNFHKPTCDKSIPSLFKTFKIFVGLWPSSFNWTICCLPWFNLPIPMSTDQWVKWQFVVTSIFNPRDRTIIPQDGIIIPWDGIFIPWDGITIPQDSRTG